MKTTRERLTVGRKGESDLIRRHKSVYELCSKYASGKRVLDLGCGDGYGSFMLAHSAKTVVGLDVDKPTIDAAKKKYKLNNLSFYITDTDTLPSLKPFDLVVSLQVLEHIENDNEYISEIKKVLNKKGILILTTPNRKLRLKDGQKPWNPFHVREYDKNGLDSLLSDYFTDVKVWGITAVRDVYDIEIKRLYIRRLIAQFDPFGIYNLIPEKWTTFVLIILKKLIASNSRKSTKKDSTKDFFITKENVNKAFDLITICRKS